MTLALCVRRAARVPVGVARVALVLGFVAPPIVASGFTFKVGTLQIVGAIGMTAFAWTVAGLTLAFVVPHATGRARALLAISSLSVVAPMILAVFWAVGQHYDVPALSIPAMARIHGSLNAIGFVGCGVFGWRAIYADLRSSMTRVQRSDSMR